MTSLEWVLTRVLSGTRDANIRFGDLRRVLVHLGFAVRIKGGHHIFMHEDVPEILNLQPRGGKAKPYQVKQVRDTIVRNRLAHDEE